MAGCTIMVTPVNSQSATTTMRVTAAITRVSRLMTARIEGMPKAESEEILAQLFDISEDPSIVYEHKWKIGDLVAWDNWCSIHMRKDFPRDQERLMRRTTITGQALGF